MASFLDRIASGPPIVADGGMGALLSAAVPRLRFPEEANLRAPEAVIGTHVSFIRSGAELIETNTFGANRPKLASLLVDDELERINSDGVKLAREAREVSGGDVLIGGSIGPVGELAEGDERRVAFAEQARLLEARGVDVFMVETFFDLDELVEAIEAVRSVSGLPIVALLSFDTGAETAGGVAAADAAARIRELGVAAIGANHGAGPQAALAALAAMDANGLPLAAMPNLGLASRWGNRIIYPHSDPQYFAEFAAHARDLGARIIGGCCGTTPLQIEAVRDALREGRVATAPIYTEERVPRPVVPADTELSGFARALADERFVVTIEINPPKGGSYGPMLDLCTDLHKAGIEFIDVTDNYTARARMHPIIASVAIENYVDVETIPHLTPRDTTLMGLESVLLGAHAAGLRNILAITGDPPSVGDYAESQGVYEVDSIGLCRIMQHMNSGESYAGQTLDAPTSFFYGVAVNPTADDVDEELRRFEQKIEAGAQYAITQSLFDFSYFEEFERKLGGWPIPVLLGVFHITSYAMALRCHNEIPGMFVPPDVLERFEQAGANAIDVGLEVARDLVAQARGNAAGVEIIPAFKSPLRALEIVR